MEAVQLGYSPMSANPRVEDGVGRFKVWAIGLSGLSISFYPIILFKYTSVMEDCYISPKEILKVKRAGDDVSTFIKAKNKVGAWVLWVFVLFPIVILEVL